MQKKSAPKYPLLCDSVSMNVRIGESIETERDWWAKVPGKKKYCMNADRYRVCFGGDRIILKLVAMTT